MAAKTMCEKERPAARPGAWLWAAKLAAAAVLAGLLYGPAGANIASAFYPVRDHARANRTAAASINAVPYVDPIMATLVDRTLKADERMTKKEQQLAGHSPSAAMVREARFTAADMWAEHKAMRGAQTSRTTVTPQAEPQLTARERYLALKSRQLQ